MKAYELRALCKSCHLRPGLHEEGLCNVCHLRVEMLRIVAVRDQAAAGEHHLAAVSDLRNGIWRLP